MTRNKKLKIRHGYAVQSDFTWRSYMKNYLKRMEQNFETVIISVLLVFITVLSTLQVIMRYCFSAISWVEEVVVLCNIWIGFIGCSYAVIRDNNLRIDADTFFKHHIAHVIKHIADFITCIFYLYIAYCGISVIERFKEINQTTPAAEIPIYYLYAALMTGALLASFRYIQRVFRTFFSIIKYRNSLGE
jgi:TRAP-type C4-dicarboxylate transport system permease small subunit